MRYTHGFVGVALVAALSCASGRARSVAGDPPAPAAAPSSPASGAWRRATKAVDDLEERIRAGRLATDVKRVDLAVQALGTFTGLGEGAVVLILCGGEDQLANPPAWLGKMTGALEKVGVATTVWACLSDLYDGQTDQVNQRLMVMSGKTMLGWLGPAGAVYAAGLEFAEYGFDVVGERAVRIANQNAYAKYVEYHAGEAGQSVGALVAVYRDQGLAALEARLDAFWDSEAVSHIRGYAFLPIFDPNYRAHFRNRFVRDYLVGSMLKEAEARHDAERRLAVDELSRQFVETMNRKVTFVVPVVERLLGTPAKGYVVSLVPEPSGSPVAKAAADGKTVELSMRLLALMNGDSFWKRWKIDVVPNAGVDGSTAGVELDLGDRGNWKSTVGADGEIRIEVAPIPVTTRVDVTASKALTLLALGPDAERGREFFYANFHEREEAIASPVPSKIPLGRYLPRRKDEAGLPQPVVTIDGPMAIADRDPPVAEAEGVTDVPPIDLSGIRAAVARLAAAVEAEATDWTVVYADYKRAFDEFETGYATYTAKVRRAVEALTKTRNRLYDEAGRRRDWAGQRKVSAEWGAKTERVRVRIDEAAKQRDEVEASARQALEALDWRVRASYAAAEKRYRAAKSRAREAQESAGSSAREVSQGLRSLASAFGMATSYPNPARAADTMRQAEEGRARVERAADAVRDGLAGATAGAAELDAARAAIAPRAAFRHGTLEDEDEVVEVRRERPRLEQAAKAVADARPVEHAAAMVAEMKATFDAETAARAKMASLVGALEALAASLPVVDANAWRAETKRLEAKRRGLVQGLLGGGGADLAALRAEIDAWNAAHADEVADLLPAPLAKETPFSRFLGAWGEVSPLDYFEFLPSDWYTRVAMPAWRKVAARDVATEWMLRLRADVVRLEATGGDDASRRKALEARVAALRAALDAAGGADALAAVARLDEAARILAEVSSSAAPDLEVAWERRRVELVRSGALERAIRASGRPFAVLTTVEGKEHGGGFFWPETFAPRDPKHPSVTATVRVEGLPAGAAAIVFTSYDAGETWRIAPAVGRDPTLFAVSATFPPGRRDAFRARVRVLGGPPAWASDAFPWIRLDAGR